jgi:aspartate aminotransferase-like enzyme
MRFIVTCYRITRLKALDSDKIKEIGEGMRDTIEAMGADFIDVAQDNDGNMVVVARYPDDSTMEAATATAQDAFGQMITQGAADGSSIDQWNGEVVMSF